MKILKILIAIILIFANKTFTQIEITFSDADQWIGGTYLWAMVEELDSTLPEINITIGENIVWDFSNLSDTMSEVEPLETTIRDLSSFEQTEFPNATHIEVEHGTENYNDFDSTGWIYVLDNNGLFYQGYLGHSTSYSHFNNDTALYFPLQFGEKKVGYNVEMLEGIAKVLSRHFNAHGKFIMPGGEEVIVLGFREMIIFTENDTDFVIYTYRFYSKEYGWVGKIYLQTVTDTTLFTEGNTYNLDSIESSSSKIDIFLRILNSPNPIEILYHPFNKKNILRVKNSSIKYTLIENGNVMIDIYTMQGKKIRSLDNGYKKAGYYEVEWDARNDTGGNVAGGVYFLKLSANGSSVSKKFTIIK